MVYVSIRTFKIAKAERIMLLAGEPTVVKGEIRKNISLKGKTILITGANTGIGYEASLDFVERGAKIIMACRDLNKAEEAKSKVVNKFISFVGVTK